MFALEGLTVDVARFGLDGKISLDFCRPSEKSYSLKRIVQVAKVCSEVDSRDLGAK